MGHSYTICLSENQIRGDVSPTETTFDQTSDSQATVLEEASKTGNETSHLEDSVSCSAAAPASPVDVKFEIPSVEQISEGVEVMTIDGSEVRFRIFPFIYSLEYKTLQLRIFMEKTVFFKRQQTEPQPKEPVRSISSYFAGVDPDASPIEPRSEGFDFLEHASIRFLPLKSLHIRPNSWKKKSGRATYVTYIPRVTDRLVSHVSLS